MSSKTQPLPKARAKRKPSAGGHFPKKGERKVGGEWVLAEAMAPSAPVSRPVQTAADRVDYLRRKAGWPPLHRKE